MLGSLHNQFVAPRRIRTISEKILSWVPDEATILDIGCGDGEIGNCLNQSGKHLSVRGMEVSRRLHGKLPITDFNGSEIPLPDQSVDVVLLIDVVHHVKDPDRLISEAARVAKYSLILKDHTLQGLLAKPTLTFMDLIGNQYSTFRKPTRYLKTEGWKELFKKLPFRLEKWEANLNLYPWPASAIFERKLHFMAKLVRTNLTN